MITKQNIDLVEAFTKAMTTEGIEPVITLFAPDCEWKIMATGETFRGLEGVREIATRSVAARDHNEGQGLLPFNVFTNAEGTKMIWEYVHKGVVTEKAVSKSLSSSGRYPAPGTVFELPIILMVEIRDNKIVEIREYFDLLTLLEPGTPHYLYS